MLGVCLLFTQNIGRHMIWNYFMIMTELTGNITSETSNFLLHITREVFVVFKFNIVCLTFYYTGMDKQFYSVKFESEENHWSDLKNLALGG
jgi:hypothetical protein